MLYSNTQDIFLYIRQQMLAKKITIKELATRMNRSQSTVSTILKQNNITLETLNDICKALNYDLEINLIEKDAETEKTTYNIAKAARGQQPLTMNKQQMESFAKSANEAPNSSQNRDMF